jgi:deoxyribose-phosphate aldolase
VEWWNGGMVEWRKRILINKFKNMSTVSELAKMIDHSILQPTHTDEDLIKQCEVARKYSVASVCVKPYAVKMAVEQLRGTGVETGCVIGFPHGNSSTSVKVFEAEQACLEGATEIDMVINIGKALGGDWAYVENEIKAIADTCHKHSAILNVIFETDYISKTEDKIALCRICTRAGADFVKTSTGFSSGGATVADIELMRKSVGKDMGIKASGGIHTKEEAMKMIEAGATRIGASAGITIISED